MAHKKNLGKSSARSSKSRSDSLRSASNSRTASPVSARRISTGSQGGKASSTKKGKTSRARKGQKEKGRKNSVGTDAKASNRKGGASGSNSKGSKTKNGIKGYTPEQLKKFRSLQEKYLEDFAVDDLKSLLQKNQQRTTGNKGELAERCADGELLGALPKCNKCGGGFIRFNAETGEYKCPGYMDDDSFKFCTYRSYSVERGDWKK